MKVFELFGRLFVLMAALTVSTAPVACNAEEAPATEQTEAQVNESTEDTEDAVDNTVESTPATDAIRIGGPDQSLLAIVENGRPASQIVIPDPPAEMVNRAANELQRYVREMTGADLDIVRQSEADGMAAIHIGPTDLARKIVAAAATRPGPEGFILRRNGNDLVIIGSNDHGTLWGVYTLLHEAGCIWPLPDKHWRVVPKTRTLHVGALDRVETPDFSVRAWHYRGHDALWEWMAFNRMNYHLQDPPGYQSAEAMSRYGITPLFTSHSFFFWVPASVLHEHPDWVAMVDGQRTLPPKDAGHYAHTQLCLANPQLQEYFKTRVLTYMKDHPKMHTVSLEANDGRGYCECPKCQAMGPDDSTRFFAFVKIIAQAAHEQFPDRKIGVLAYANHTEVPKLDLPPNVSIGVVQNNRHYGKPLDAPENTEYFQRLKAWTAAGYHPWIYELFAPVTWPDYVKPYARVLAHDIKQVYQPMGISGMLPEALRATSLESMIPGTYVYMQGMWNAEIEADAAVAELCRKVYGPAAEPMAAYYRTLEDRAAVYFKTDSVTDLSRFLLPIADECRRHLDDALARVAAADDDVKHRVRQEVQLFEDSLSAAMGWMPAESLAIDASVRQANRVKNGSFELTAAQSGDWRNNTMEGKFEFDVVGDQAFDGDRSAMIRTIEPGWGRYYQRVTDLDPQKTYIVSVAVKTTDTSDKGGAVWIGNGASPVAFHHFGPSPDRWMRFTIRDCTGPKGLLDIYLTSKGNGGTIYWDDLVVCDQELWDQHVRR